MQFIMSMVDNGKQKLIIIWPIVALGAVYFASALVPLDRMWGFNLLKFHAIGFHVAVAVLLLMVSLPRSMDWPGGGISKMAGAWESIPKFWRTMMVATISFTLFYLMRVHVHSLGDGYQRINQIEKGDYFYHTELLDFFLHAVLYRFLNLLGQVSGESAYALYSMICGTVFVTVIYRFKVPAGWMNSGSSYIKWLILTMGGIQLFFGYAESYSLYYPMSVIYILMAARYLETGKGIIWTTVLFVLLPFVHLTGIFLLPSMLYIIYRNYRSNRVLGRVDRAADSFGRHLPVIILAVSMILLIIIILLAEIKGQSYSGGLANKLLPLFSVGTYSVFSISHILDVFNELLLVIPIGLVMIFYLLRRRGKNEGAGLTYFYGIISASAILFLLLVNPQLGFARDWDLFSIPAASLGVVIMLSFLKSYSGSGGKDRILRSLVMGSVVFSGVWVMTNSSVNIQFARAEEILKLNENARRYGTELLAQYYLKETGNLEKGLELLEGIPDNMKNGHVYSAIARTELDLERYDKALQAARLSIGMDSLDPLPNFVAGSALIGMDSAGSALPYLLEAERLVPNDPKILNMLGRAYMGTGDIARAGQCFRRIIQLDSKFTVAYFNLGFLFYRTGQLDSAYFYTAKGLNLDSSSAMGRQLMNTIIRRAQETGRQ